MNKTQKIVLFSIIGVVLTGLITALIIRINRKKIKSNSTLLKKNKTLVCSHIGQIENGSKAENNLENIKKLIDSNIDMVEIDIQITKDNVGVLFHDNELDKKTNGTGKIQSKNWNEVKEIRYNNDKNQGIDKLSDVINYLKQSGKQTILQLDKCDSKEIKNLSNQGYFKGIEKQLLVKNTTFKKSQEVINSGLMYMPIIPSNYVGKMNKMSMIDDIVNKCKGFNFLEAQFSDADTLLIDGTLSKKLADIDCRLLVVAVKGSDKTSPKSFWGLGDNSKQWAKIINPMKAGVIMTNKPLALKEYIDNL